MSERPGDTGARARIIGRLDALVPRGTRTRRVAEWGIVAWALIGVVLIGWMVWLLLHRLAGVLPFLVVAGLVVFILEPAVDALEKMRVPRLIAATGVFLATAAAMPAIVPVVVRTVLAQLGSLLRSSPESLQHGGVVARLSHSSNSVLRSIGHAVEHWVRTHQQDPGHTLATVGSILAHSGVVLLLGGFLGYLILVSRPGLSSGLMVLVPPARRQVAIEVVEEMGRIVAGFVRARLIVSIVVGLFTTLGLWIIGMPSWLILGILVGIANLIPTLGAFVGGVPVVLVSLLTKPPAFLLAAVAVMLVAHAVDGYILSPIVLKETTNLHPVIVLLAVVAGAEVLGLWGVFAAIPVAGIVQYCLRRWVGPKLFGWGDQDPPAPVSAGDLPPQRAGPAT
jgi:predicted PurR-regulated permease PerM